MEVMRGKWKKVKTEPTIMGNRPSTYNLRTHQELFSRNPKTGMVQKPYLFWPRKFGQ